MPESILTEGALRRGDASYTAHSTITTELTPKRAAEKAPAAVAPAPFAEPYEAISEALASAQEIARGTALSLADSRLQTARAFISVQQKLLEMAHANLRASFAAAQKIAIAPNFIEAVRLHSLFAQEQVRSLTEQAAELRQLSTAIAEKAPEPWVESLTRLKKGFEK